MRLCGRGCGLFFSAAAAQDPLPSVQQQVVGSSRRRQQEEALLPGRCCARARRIPLHVRSLGHLFSPRARFSALSWQQQQQLSLVHTPATQGARSQPQHSEGVLCATSRLLE